MVLHRPAELARLIRDLRSGYESGRKKRHLGCYVPTSCLLWTTSTGREDNLMRKWFFLLTAVPLAIALPAENFQSPDTVQTTPAYVQSKDGFRTQLDAIVQSYRA